MTCQSKIYRNLPIILLMLSLGIASIALMFYATPFGVGLYYDSMNYIEGGRNIVGVGSLGSYNCNSFKPMTSYPPLYPLTLSFFELINISSYRGARLISAVSYSLTSILSFLIVRRTTGSSTFGFIAALLIVGSGLMLSVYSWAMSEPIYMVLLLATLLMASLYLDRRRRYLLVLSAILAGLTLLTRFVGIAVIASVLLALLLSIHFQLRERIKTALAFSAISLLPMVIWLIRNKFVAGNLAARTISFHPPNQEEYATLINSVSRWFTPATVETEKLWFVCVVIVLGVSAIIWIYFQFFRSRLQDWKPDLTFLVISNIVIYIGILIFSMTFLDDGTHPENRILIPIYVELLLLIVTACGFTWRMATLPGKILVALVIGLFLLFQLQNLQKNIHVLRTDGQGYASSRWRQSETARALKQMSTSVIYTNDKVAVYFLSNKPSCAIPTANNQHALETMMESLENNNGAVLVVFGNITGEFMSLEKLTTGLNSVGFQDGAIYGYR